MLLALVGFAGSAHAAWMTPPAPYRAKDFTIVKRDGWYHCFYIRRDTTVPLDSTERDLGHAISRDFYNWTQLPAVLPTRADHWDNAKIWAPEIREVDGVYYMFYTGVTQTPGQYAYYQQIGFATSTDLMTWNRYDEPLLSCADVRWAYCDPLEYTGGEFRDACVIPNPSGPGWLMYYTARPASSPNTNVVGMASSDGDLTRWVNREPLWITHLPTTESGVAESPHVFRHDGSYYLVFTGDGGQPLRLATSPDPAGALESWTYRGTIGAMLGLNTQQWFAPEYIVDGTREFFCFINYDRVDVREIAWGSDWQFTLQPPPLFRVYQMSWDVPEAMEGERVRLRFEAVNTFANFARLEAVAVDADGGEQPIPLAELALPDSVAMTGPITDYWWTARRVQDPGEADATARIVVRLKDRTASAPVLVVLPDTWELEGDPPAAGPTMPGAHESNEPGRAPAAAKFRTLADSPFAGPALLVELGAPAAARVAIFDLSGRLVRVLADRELPAGATILAWDGRGGGGTRVPPGVYFARLATAAFHGTARILVAR